MNLPSNTPSPARLSPEWQDWLAQNIVRGCVDADLQRTMAENGFDAHYARAAISVVRSMTERLQQQAPAVLTQYHADPIRLPAAARARAHDREVGISFVLSDPNVALLTDLLDEDECHQLIVLSSGKMKRSEVIDRATGRSEVSGVRTSEGTHFERAENAIVEHLERRIAALTGLSVDHGEPLQILHYHRGGEYLPHHDYFDPKDEGSAEHLRVGGQRIATAVIYLDDVPAGGETVFPSISLSVRPRRGCAVYFEYFNRTGETDPRCLHAGAPVQQGEKWIATKWLRQAPYSQGK